MGGSGGRGPPGISRAGSDPAGRDPAATPRPPGSRLQRPDNGAAPEQGRSGGGANAARGLPCARWVLVPCGSQTLAPLGTARQGTAPLLPRWSRRVLFIPSWKLLAKKQPGTSSSSLPSHRQLTCKSIWYLNQNQNSGICGPQR